jgi:hypothetical protein
VPWHRLTFPRLLRKAEFHIIHDVSNARQFLGRYASCSGRIGSRWRRSHTFAVFVEDSTGAGDRFRTDDLVLGKHTLYQLSYTRSPGPAGQNQNIYWSARRLSNRGAPSADLIGFGWGPGSGADLVSNRTRLTPSVITSRRDGGARRWRNQTAARRVTEARGRGAIRLHSLMK